ncbi:protocatechuate 3,4-dioxygenase subunit alpha [Tropicimonas isoalkanivorans]|uniref:Protocatechuate 3,4-dioxygenase, alpha subunit n=1 Tax=Tropicimonas isoalkanivorans TaxID=441112 RepID=A0A1I1PV60_9RHOB|nr:protocatechuate 3,4-dioxygenase subunit alpha [Tropicimonas isoalkanivorans]SFD09790.1 protocatechuate 3,4-dioxygenase, alpha subunit [Tropicimonas isoalkanivorans]
MVQKLDYLKETPSQTAGPYVHIGLAPGAAGFDIYQQELGWDIAGPNAKGERIRVEGIVIDATGSPVKDVMLEAWQANSEGVYAHPESPGEVEEGFRGWGRVITDFETGEWGFDTIKPGPVAARAAMGGEVRPAADEELQDAYGRGHAGLRQMAPHINLWIVARGINIGLNTRIYFEDEAEANAEDPVMNLIEWERRRKTLIATRTLRDGLPVYRFDIKLQGEDETVFFDI